MLDSVSDPRRALRQLLADWQSAGLTHIPAVKLPPAEVATAAVVPTSRPSDAVRPPAPVLSAESRPPVATAEITVPVESPRAEIPDPRPVSTLGRERREAELQALAERVAGCQRCHELASARTQTVFGVGNPQAQVMFIGEAPGADEDAQGEPFVGRAGQLLNKIIEACGWKRQDLYICNILRCRPPGNRNPTPEEAGNCREYLDGQIRLVDPDYIVCWGSVAAQNLLGETTPIGKLRQRWLSYGRARVMCTYHPSYLLRNPAAKKPVWDDMKFLLAEMGLQPPA